MTRRRPPISPRVLADLHARLGPAAPITSPGLPWYRNLGTWLLLGGILVFVGWMALAPIVLVLDWLAHTQFASIWGPAGFLLAAVFLLGLAGAWFATMPLRSMLAALGSLLALATAVDVTIGATSMRDQDVFIFSAWGLMMLDRATALHTTPGAALRWMRGPLIVLSLLAGTISFTRIWPDLLPQVTVVAAARGVHMVVVLCAMLALLTGDPSIQRQFRKS